MGISAQAVCELPFYRDTIGGVMADYAHTPESPTDVMGSFKVDERSGVPIWLQIRKRLAYLIVSGKYACGERLPSVRELSVTLGVNYNTVNKVYQDLERDGFIVTKRGRGSYVADASAIDHASGKGDVEAIACDFVQCALANGMEPDDIVDLVREQIARLGHSC